MSNFQMDKGRMKFGKYSLSNLALAEVGATVLFLVLTIVKGWSAYKDARTVGRKNLAPTGIAGKLSLLSPMPTRFSCCCGCRGTLCSTASPNGNIASAPKRFP